MVGVGSEYRSDDALGSIIARSLKKRSDFLPIDAGDIPENYTGVIKDFRPDSILFIDAVNYGGNPGSIIFTTPESLTEKRFNTHRPSLRHVMEYLKAETGARITLLGVQPEEIKPGLTISQTISSTIESIKLALSEFLDMTSDEGES